jgi:hypothetical protein
MVDGTANFTQKDGVSLRDYVDSRLAAIEKATTVAYDSMNKRLETMNEFRQSMQDMRGETVTRSEFSQMRERLTLYASCAEVDSLRDRVEQMRQVRESQIKALEDEIQSLSEFRAELRGKASQQSVLIALGVSAVGVFLSIISIIEKVAK